MPSRFGRTVAALAVWPALLGIATGAARGQVEAPAQLSDVSPASGALPATPPPPLMVRRVRVGLLFGGAAVFLAGWLPALIIGDRGGGGCDDQACRDSFDVLGIPVVGPLLASSKNSNFGTVALLFTLVQVGGIAMSVVGVIGRKVPVEPAKSSWRLTPAISRGGAGLVFGATF